MQITTVAGEAQDIVAEVLGIHEMLRRIGGPVTKADAIGFSLLRAALEDGLAMTGLLGHIAHPLIGPALTLHRPFLEKLKRAAWVFAAPDEDVVSAFENDKFPGAAGLVEVIEASDKGHTLFTQLFESSGSQAHNFVHGGKKIIEIYFDDNVDRLNPDELIRAVLGHVRALAIEAGLVTCQIAQKYDDDTAFQMAARLERLITKSH